MEKLSESRIKWITQISESLSINWEDGSNDRLASDRLSD